MRTINVNTITENIKDMCIQANHFLADDMDKAMKHALETEEAPLGRQILDQLQDNLKIAAEDMIPICQDTGMAVIFMKMTAIPVSWQIGIMSSAAIFRLSCS